MGEGLFKGLSMQDWLEIYDAENPLAEILRKFAAAWMPKRTISYFDYRVRRAEPRRGGGIFEWM